LWSCRVDSTCARPTTLTGKVFDPGGHNPLNDIVVFVPNEVTTLAPIAQGVSGCDACETSIRDYVSVTTTDASGSFTLSPVPTGMGVPVTVQIGKWRRTVPVDILNDCEQNTVSMTPSSDVVLRLPSTQSEGDMPQMALLTGGCGRMACFLAGMGIAPGEFTAPHAGGRVDVYQGLGADGGGPGLSDGAAGDCTGASCPLWATMQDLQAYDLVILDCECGEHNETKPAPAVQTMHDWLGAGGRVFATHYQDTWFKNGPADFQSVAGWLPVQINGPTPGPFEIDTSWSWGRSFQEWMIGLSALDSDGGLAFDPANVSASVSSVNAASERWIYGSVAPSGRTQALSFNTPIAGMGGLPSYCGRVTFTDVHAGGGGQSSSAPVPSSCTASAAGTEQQTLEFLFFHLWSGACVAP
jgi:hypothetical protein